MDRKKLKIIQNHSGENIEISIVEKQIRELTNRILGYNSPYANNTFSGIGLEPSIRDFANAIEARVMRRLGRC